MFGVTRMEYIVLLLTRRHLSNGDVTDRKASFLALTKHAALTAFADSLFDWDAHTRRSTAVTSWPKVQTTVLYQVLLASRSFPSDSQDQALALRRSEHTAVSRLRNSAPS